MFGIGAGELIMILIAGLVIFGPGKLPELGRTLGKGLREFRKAQALLRSSLDEVSLENKQQTVSLNKNTSAEKTNSTENINSAENKEPPTVKNEPTISLDKNIAIESQSTEKNISEEKKVVLEKDNSPKVEISAEKTAVSTDDVIQMAKNNPFANPEPQNIEQNISEEKEPSTENISLENKQQVVSLDKKVSEEKKKDCEKDNSPKIEIATEQNNLSEKKNLISVYDVIALAKNNYFVKEAINEKIFGGNGIVTVNTDIGKCIESSRSDTDCA